jgi:CubicO group peptidase (beta-lactamase class C family)
MKTSGLDRRALLTAAAASAGVLAPAAVRAQSPAAPITTPNAAERREAAMSNGGLSRARLARMHDVMSDHVARGQVPGLVALISRRGETHVDAVGMKAIGGREPMQRDTIFRIAR